MKVSELTINSLVPLITGDSSPAPYLSGRKIIEFFKCFGRNDEYTRDGLPDALSRSEYVKMVLNDLNGKPVFKDLIEAIVDERRGCNGEELAKLLSVYIKHDGYGLLQDESGIRRVSGGALSDPIEVAAYFDNIREEIIERIRGAEFVIWVAVAWFTERSFGKELWKKQKDGVNVRVIVNDDETTEKHGLKLADGGIEIHKISPNSKFGSKIMHNKFCIIDFECVIFGSYNWTSSAEYNNESITISEDRKLALEFSREFVKLVAEKKV